MIFFRPLILLLASGLLLGGCASNEPAGTGNTVRNIMASQILPPQLDKRRAGTDAGIAISAFENYQKSYETPKAQNDNPTFGKK
ncbi:hypothetical protein [Pseudoduganella buxea]|uniref:Pilus assembly protein n=1 Tax=Pseudoduganella buxea TaxID=1949069 RepID=A0A6I3STB9_9BURK|nr:hypothetical protein [Pseudoduganella buxea]MTV52430.1 hypothetical protein [Pseudoduganella buxea]GGC18144.1 hypothetical protein GCM10011572_44350 [Pseudoduganella buxea]